MTGNNALRETVTTSANVGAIALSMRDCTLKRLFTAAPILLLIFAINRVHAASDADGTAQRIVAAGGPSVFTATAASSASIPASLEARMATIGDITIYNDNIFDLNDPRENKWLYRAANRLHVRTRPEVIKSQLLFHEGEVFSVQAIEESERLLRGNRYIREAEITPVVNDDGTVDLDVRTQDVWTLNPGISFGRSGGSNSGGVSIKEYNLLGTGTYVGASYKSNVDRTTTTLQYADNNVFRSRNQLFVSYGNNSDGFSREFGLARPFYALDTRRAGGLMLQQNERVDSLYDRGSIVADFNHASDLHEAFFGWSGGLKNNWTKRFTTGVTYQRDAFSANPDSTFSASPVPEDRQYLYPFIGLEWLQDRYEKAANYDQIDRTEDRYVGTRFGMRLGYSAAAAGSSADAWHLGASFNEGLIVEDRQSLLLDGDLAARLEGGVARNTLLSMNARYYRRQSGQNLFFARLSGSLGHNLDIDNPVVLGGDSGLRGYPLRYQSGDRKLLLTLEQRVFTEWYPFRLFHIGGAVFFDVGRTWGVDAVASTNLGWLRDAGIGLRIGNSRSSTGRIVHVDLAFPMDGEADISKVQLLVEAKSGF
jgi:outer membrane protein assembly factor BamA